MANAREQARKVALKHRVVRYAVQIAFFVLAPALFSGAFSAVKYLCAQIGASQPMEMTAFVILLIAVLAFTVVFGRFFCGYACAFGTLGDVLHGLFAFVVSKTPLPKLEFPRPVVRVLSYLKYVVLAAICITCYFGVWSAYSGYSPWVAFSGILSGSLEGIDTVALVLLGVVAVCMIVRERFFCQFLCPLGAVFSLMPVLGFSQYTRVRAHCARKCGKCRDACPVDIWPDADTLLQGECIACGHCADACPMNNVNLVALQRSTSTVASEVPDETDASAAPAPKPLRKTREAWRIWRGTSVGYTLLKALLLFGLCWVLGVTRYIPPFAEVVGSVPWPF